ncbi:MAG: helix-turn-helix transcriptional regulator [Flavobacteriales bacterium]|nr:helix-turn-helix transcriptional regulator [Flavobacteriales bacterium]
MAKQENSKFSTVGRRLKSLRIENGFSNYPDLAAELAIEPKQYWLLEKDLVDFRISSLARILKYYKLSPAEFFEDVQL